MALVAACSPDGDPKEKSSPSPSPTSVAVPTWSPEKPKKPENMNQQTKAGVKSFVRYYYELFEYERHGKYWTGVKSLSVGDCHMCNVLTRGEWARNYRPEAPAKLDLSEPTFEGDRGRIAVDRVSASGTWRANPYEEPRRFAKQQWQDVLYVVYKDGRWLVDGIEVHFTDPVKDPTAPYRW